LPIGVMIAQAARTGATVSDHEGTTAEINVPIRLQAQLQDDGTANEAASITLSDNSATGVFFDSNQTNCTDNEGANPTLSVNASWLNKNFCYANSVAGNYTISVQVSTSTGNVGSPATFDVTVTEPVAPQVVTATNFNTHSGADYEGINVGFTLNDQFGTVEAVKVELFKGGDLIVENNHNQALLDLINGGEQSLSTPFIINDGTYVETYWNLGSHS